MPHCLFPGAIAARSTAKLPVSPLHRSIPTLGCGLCQCCGRKVVEEGRSEEVLVHGDAVADDEELDSQEPEVEPIRTAPTPDLPTQAEMDEHALSHIPPDDWCEAGSRCKCVNFAHGKISMGEALHG